MASGLHSGKKGDDQAASLGTVYDFNHRNSTVWLISFRESLLFSAWSDFCFFFPFVLLPSGRREQASIKI